MKINNYYFKLFVLTLLINLNFLLIGLTSSDPTETSVAIDTQVMRPIKGESRLVSNDMKFRSFVCLAISRGVFIQWLAELPLLGGKPREDVIFMIFYEQSGHIYMHHIHFIFIYRYS